MEGDLSTISIADVMELLHGGRRTGRLELKVGELPLTLRFVGGAGPTLAAIVRPGLEAPVQEALGGYAGPGGRTLILGPGAGYTWRET